MGGLVYDLPYIFMSKLELVSRGGERQKKQDRSRQCQNIQSIDNFFSENTYLIDKILSNLLSTGPN